MIKKSKIDLSYSIDWIVVIIVLVGSYVSDKIEPNHRFFSLEDKTIQFPFATKETIPQWLCIVLALVVPFVIIVAVATIKKQFRDFHHGLLGLILSLSLTLLATQIFKILVGRPRPDFIDRCQPMEGSIDKAVYGLSSIEICTKKDLLKDGFKSFVSGHSSSSFAGLGFLSFYLAGKLQLFDKKGHAYKGFVVALPLLVATSISLSRTKDNRHHWQDVLAGSILGFVISYYAYRQYYPSLKSSEPGEPYPTRSKIKDTENQITLAKGVSHFREEEVKEVIVTSTSADEEQKE